MARTNLKIISVSSSSKKAGKSSLASYLVRELGADFGLKVSSGGTHPTTKTIISDPRVVERNGTDTGSLVKAGAKQVIWVNSADVGLKEELGRAFSMFPDNGLIVVEGNSALEHIDPDFAVFLMAVPFEEFKSSARRALPLSDLVIVDRSGSLSRYEEDELAAGLKRIAPGAKTLFFSDKGGRDNAWREAAITAREMTE